MIKYVFLYIKNFYILKIFIRINQRFKVQSYLNKNNKKLYEILF